MSPSCCWTTHLYPVYTIKLARRTGYVSWTSRLDVCSIA